MLWEYTFIHEFESQIGFIVFLVLSTKMSVSPLLVRTLRANFKLEYLPEINVKL